MTYTINELNGSGKRVVLTEGNGREDAANVCHLTDYDVRNILERYHKDLERAPFDHDACLSCDRCSSSQLDLFENCPKAYCLDPDCWARKVRELAEKKVEQLKAAGRDARIGSVDDYEDEAYMHQIRTYRQDELKKAEEAGIAKRVLVDPETAEESEYYDERDLPGWHEVTEEEREAKHQEHERLCKFNDTRKDMTKERLRNAIRRKIEHDGDKDDIIALLLFCCYDLDDTIDESQYDLLGIKNDEDRCAGLSDIDDQVSPCDIHDAVLGSVEHILDRTYDEDILRKMYSIITYGNPDDEVPVDDEVEDELSRKNAESEHDEEEEGDDE